MVTQGKWSRRPRLRSHGVRQSEILAFLLPLTRHVENVALMDEAQDPFAGTEVIYAYTRKDALADGVQIDVSEVG